MPTDAIENAFRWDRHKASDEQLFVCFASALSMQQLSHEVADTIRLAYSVKGLHLPEGVRLFLLEEWLHLC